MAKNRNRVSADPCSVSAAFIESYGVIQRFLAKYFAEPQDIEDVAQEAFLRAYVAEQHKRIDKPGAYLMRIARNLALTKLSKKSRQITDYIEEMGVAVVIESNSAVDLEVEAEEALGLYCEAVANLPVKMRQVYLLRKVHGLSHKEIADRLSLSVSSVEKYLRSGILACRHYVHKRQSNESSERDQVAAGRKV